jgi:hypothetical protein
MSKLILRVPTMGKKAGEEIDVKDVETADALVANGTARRKAAVPKKSDKD